MRLFSQDPGAGPDAPPTWRHDPDKGNARRDAAQARKRIAPLKKDAQKIEDTITKHAKEIEALDRALAVDDLFTTDPDRALSLSQERASKARGMEDLESDWLAALERYEAAKVREGISDS